MVNYMPFVAVRLSLFTPIYILLWSSAIPIVFISFTLDLVLNSSLLVLELFCRIPVLLEVHSHLALGRTHFREQVHSILV